MEVSAGSSRRVSKLPVLALVLSLLAPAYFCIGLVGPALSFVGAGFDNPIPGFLTGLFPKCVIQIGGVGLRPYMSCVERNTQILLLATCPVALALGVISLVRIRRRKKELRGEGLALAATIISGVTTTLGVFAVGVIIGMAWLLNPWR